jgi:hypothetical protein
LIDVMSDQELINNVGSLQKRGAFSNADIKAKIDARLAKAKTSKKISALKSMEARKVANVDEATSNLLAGIADTQIKSKGRIQLDTALLIDKSSSMSNAIEVGKRVGSMISAAMADDAKFYAYAFDTMPYPIQTQGKTLKDWENALRGITANGATGNSAPIILMTRAKIKVDQIVMITDEGENQNPTFTKALQDYSTAMGIRPTVMILRVYSNRMYRHTIITDSLRRNGFEVEDLEITGTDYYSEPTILQFLTRKSKLELLMEVMTWPVPQRKPA